MPGGTAFAPFHPGQHTQVLPNNICLWCSRYWSLLSMYVCGAAIQMASAIMLLRQRNFIQQERLKGQQFILTISAGMVRQPLSYFMLGHL